MSINIFIVRICLLPLRNPLTIDNLPIYSCFQDAYQFAESFIKTNNTTMYLILITDIICMKTLWVNNLFGLRNILFPGDYFFINRSIFDLDLLTERPLLPPVFNLYL